MHERQHERHSEQLHVLYPIFRQFAACFPSTKKRRSDVGPMEVDSKDVAERLPAVGDLVHGIRNPAPGDRSNWMRENKAHLENKRLYQISMVSHTVYHPQTVADSSLL
jgi:hypothetical protein